MSTILHKFKGIFGNKKSGNKPASEVNQKQNHKQSKFTELVAFYLSCRNPSLSGLKFLLPNTIAYNVPYIDALSEDRYYHPTPFTTIELQINELSAKIRENTKWPELIQKDGKEFYQYIDTIENKTQSYSVAQKEYVLEQLVKYYLPMKLENDALGIELSSVMGCYQSDNLFKEDFRLKLLDTVIQLESKTDDKVWRYDGHCKLLELTNCSLYAFVNELSPILNREQCNEYLAQFTNENNTDITGTKSNIGKIAKCLMLMGSGEAMNILSPEPKETQYLVVKKPDYFQWLPTEFYISSKGKAQCRSYINNLHPVENPELYTMIEHCVEKMIPLFNKVLTDSLTIKQTPVIRPNEEFKFELKNMPIPNKDNRINLYGTHLQIIVRLSSIELTPEFNEYKGGVWHVEGLQDENIVATGIYYYSSENITESLLSFRTKVQLSREYDTEASLKPYGLKFGDLQCQDVGSIVTKTHRTVCFPNLYQHNVKPFQLIDKTKPGHRKIIALFLINPNTPILSTLHIPPQQSEWFAKEIRNYLNLLSMPNVLSNIILDYIHDIPISLKLAQENELALGEERKEFVKNNMGVHVRRVYLTTHTISCI